MLITKPSYFDDFRCIASACPDSCCKEWDVEVDDASAAFYQSLSGPLGDRLREVLYTEDGKTYLSIVDRRCPMWRQDSLCRIQAELGEQALCKTCREFPRLTHDYGDFVEYGLELSCPEAARIILSAPSLPAIREEIPGNGDEEPEYDLDVMEDLIRTREEALRLIADGTYSVREMLCLLLIYGYHAQDIVDGNRVQPFETEPALETAREYARACGISPLLDFYAELEILTPQWRHQLCHPAEPEFPETVRNLARYFVERYWLQAISDYDIALRVKFIVISCLVICTLGGSFADTAQLYSKEVENNYDNVEAILDSAYSSPVFTDDKLLGLLLGANNS